MQRTVSVLAYEGMSAFETGITTEVFGLRWPDIDEQWYEFTLCTEGSRQVSVLGGATLSTPHGLDALAAAQTVIIPSVSDVTAAISPELIAALQLAHDRGARIVSICSGAFALAAAGLLDGRRATTHWQYAQLLSRRYPRIHVDPGPLYIDDGDLLTSAGCAAGLDLCLHIVRADFGAAVATAIARRLVIPPHRDGGQAQYIESPIQQAPDDDNVARSMAWAIEHLPEPITLPMLARHAQMTRRTYLRQFARSTGTTPIRWLIHQRIHASLSLLEGTDKRIEDIAYTVGFDSPVTYRHHFNQTMGTPPSTYRRTFRAGQR
jgi:AraC family transcriptional activator FtrA